MIHPSALVHKDVKLPKNIEIGPYSIIEEGVKLGQNCKIHSHVTLHSFSQIGDHNEFFNGVIIGGKPQDKNWNMDDSNKEKKLIIGNHNIFREYSTVHHGTQSQTTIGDHNYFMAYSHIAHDCHVHNHITLANYTALAGWVEVMNHAFLSGHVLVHQHCRIGDFAMIGGLCRINQDIAPYSLIAQENGKIAGINQVGLKRAGFSYDKIKKLQKIFYFFTKRKGYREKPLEDSLKPFYKSNLKNEIQNLYNFYHESKKGILIKWLKEKI